MKNKINNIFVVFSMDLTLQFGAVITGRYS